MFTEQYFGLMLLSKEDKYVDCNGQLPVRPHNDKTILLLAVSDKTILCSENVKNNLPRSVINISDGIVYEYDMITVCATGLVNLGVSTFDIMPPILYIVRSIAMPRPGKILRYRDKYKYINTVTVEGTLIEKWRLK